MARPREFEMDVALKRAMEVFWSHGYEGASLPMLLEGMSLTRGSLYKAFTDKKTLFLASIELYESEAVAPAVALLSDAEIKDGLQRIEHLFRAVVDNVRSGDRRGCLLCSAAAAPSSDDPDIAKSVNALIADMQGGFHTALNASKRHAKDTDQTRADLSVLLMTQYIGIRILARSQASVAVLDRAVAALLGLLRQTR